MSPLQQRVYDAIKSQGAERITLTAFAESLGMTKGHLDVIITGMTANGVLQKVRPTIAQRIKLKV